MRLGKLQEVDIRKIWAHEQYDFSKWLSSESNIVLGSGEKSHYGSGEKSQ